MADPAPVRFNQNGHRVSPLTRPEMVDVLREGGSVMLPSGKVITQERYLPHAAELTGGDPIRKAEAEAALRSDIAKLQATLGELRAGTLDAAHARPKEGPYEPATGIAIDPSATQVIGPDGLTDEQRRARDDAARAALLQGAPAPEAIPPVEAVNVAPPGATPRMETQPKPSEPSEPQQPQQPQQPPSPTTPQPTPRPGPGRPPKG